MTQQTHDHNHGSLFYYNVAAHSHGDHAHFNVVRATSKHHHHGHTHDHHHHHDHDHSQCGGCDDKYEAHLRRSDEGCPCCATAIDLDEVATAINEIQANTGNSGHHGHRPHTANFNSAAHWGIFLGISGPLALVGLTAAMRNVKGTMNNRKKLKAAVEGLEKDINIYKERRNSASPEDQIKLDGVIQRLEAFKNTLEYSKFDTDFNLAVPGVINGAASTAVMSTAVLASPLALPIIAVYAGCQTMRNGYDLWRIWNKILPEEVRDDVEMNVKVGTQKINQITDSKRKFYAANSTGFSIFAAGAIVTGLAATAMLGPIGMLVGIPLLAAGAVATGITNNIWTNKFKPRNADLGVPREQLSLDHIPKEIGERQHVKKILKNYREKHVPKKNFKHFCYSLVASLPFLDQKGATLLHHNNQARIAESDATDGDRLDLMERVINTKLLLKHDETKQDLKPILKKLTNFKDIDHHEKKKYGLVEFKQNGSAYEQIFHSLRELEIDTMVLDRFIQNAFIKPTQEHDTSLHNKDEFLAKIKGSGLFQIEDQRISFNIEKLDLDANLKQKFIQSLEECLLFDYVDKLKYEQYGLNDFYWALDKQNKKHPVASPNITKENNKECAKGTCGHHHAHDHHHDEVKHPSALGVQDFHLTGSLSDIPSFPPKMPPSTQMAVKEKEPLLASHNKSNDL